MNKFFAFLFITLMSVSAWSAGTLKVVASIQTLASLAEEIGGEKVEVTSLSKGYMDPHFVQAKPSLVLDLHRADLLIYVGLELEKGWLPPLILGSRNANIRQGAEGHFEVSTVVEGIKRPATKVDRSMGDIHPLGNPHFWIPPKNALAIARGIRDHLKTLQPGSGDYFDARYKAFADKVAATEKELEPRIAKLKGMKVVPYHDSWAYVTDWLQLDEVGFVEPKPGIPPDPAHLVALINTMKQVKAKAILMENFYNKDIASSVAEKSGAKLLTMPSDVGATPEIKGYSDLVKAVVTTLGEAL